jgi:hypothetical protein
MISNYLPVIGILLLTFVVYMAVRPLVFGTDGFAGYEPNTQPAPSPLEVRQGPAYEKPRRIAASGPNPPAQAPEEGEAVIYGEPAATDPYAGAQQAADAPEELRHPDRAFRPAPQNDLTGLASAAGIAGESAQNSPQAYQKFGTDFIQNSGEFMTGIYANDTMSDTNFSSF